MVEQGLWHPVLAADSLQGDRPVAARLLGDDLVLWRDATGAPQAWADRCPHRGTRLSLGSVRPGADGTARLECPYHGWQFAASGQCVVVPALPEFTPPATHRACTHEALEAHGLVWVRMAPGDSGVPPFEAGRDARLRTLLCGPYTVETSAPRIVENFLDMAHFAFVHEGWLGDRAHVALADYRIEPTPTGFVATGCQAWQPQSNRLSGQGRMVDYRYELTSPFSAVLVKLSQQPGEERDEIGLFVCPQDPERSVVWFRLAVTDHVSSDPELRAFQHTIFTQDQPILESQSPKRLPLRAGDDSRELNCAADRASAAYRRVLSERGISFGVC
ncbi:MAG: aromatic ring-hydroxylating dioxygenase subunit alpha [Burkholderiaceae bacterium]